MDGLSHLPFSTRNHTGFPFKKNPEYLMRRFIVYDIYSQTVQLLQISKVRTDDCVSDSMINGDTLEAGFIR